MKRFLLVLMTIASITVVNVVSAQTGENQPFFSPEASILGSSSTLGCTIYDSQMYPYALKCKDNQSGVSDSAEFQSYYSYNVSLANGIMENTTCIGVLQNLPGDIVQHAFKALLKESLFMSFFTKVKDPYGLVNGLGIALSSSPDHQEWLPLAQLVKSALEDIFKLPYELTPEKVTLQMKLYLAQFIDDIASYMVTNKECDINGAPREMYKDMLLGTSFSQQTNTILTTAFGAGTHICTKKQENSVLTPFAHLRLC